MTKPTQVQIEAAAWHVCTCICQRRCEKLCGHCKHKAKQILTAAAEVEDRKRFVMGAFATPPAAAEVGDKDDIERAFEAGSKHGWESVKAATIERCAQIAEDFDSVYPGESAVAAAIRALKDKP